MAAKSTPLVMMTRRAQMCISGNSFSRSRGIESRDPTRVDLRDSFHLVIRYFASWNGLGLISPQSQPPRTAVQNVARSLGSHLKRCMLKPLSTRSFTFTLVPLQKSSKRKATEKAASDSDDDAQLSEEDRPSVKPVKTVKKVCEGTRIRSKSSSRRPTAKNCL